MAQISQFPTAEQVRDRMSVDGDLRRRLGFLFGEPTFRDTLQTLGDQHNQETAELQPAAAPAAAPAIAAKPAAAAPGVTTAAPAAPLFGNPAQPQFKAPLSREEFLKMNPAIMPKRPQVPWDTASTKRKVGAGIFAGLAEFGAALNGRQAGTSDMLFGTPEERQAQRLYDSNIDVMRDTANAKGYAEYLGTEAAKSNIANTQDEITQRGFERGQKTNAQQQAALAAIREMVEKRNPNVTAYARRIAPANGLDWESQVVPVLEGTAATVPRFKVQKGEGGRPSGLEDVSGNVYTADKAGQLMNATGQPLNDPEAVTLWKNAVDSHAQEFEEKEKLAKLTGSMRNEARLAGPVIVTDPETGISHYLTAKEAIKTNAIAGSKTDVNAVRGKNAVFKDVKRVVSTSVGSVAALDQGVAQSGLIAQALGDAETTGAKFLQSQIAKKMTPQSRDYVTAVLSLREQIMGLNKVLTGAAGTSDARVQAIWDTLPGVEPDSDMALRKLVLVEQMIANLEEATPVLPGKEAGAAQQAVTITKQHVQDFAKQQGITYDAAKKALTAKGAKVKD